MCSTIEAVPVYVFVDFGCEVSINASIVCSIFVDCLRNLLNSTVFECSNGMLDKTGLLIVCEIQRNRFKGIPRYNYICLTGSDIEAGGWQGDVRLCASGSS